MVTHGFVLELLVALMSTKAGINQEKVFDELSSEWLSEFRGPESVEASELLRAIIADWASAANVSDDPEAINVIQRATLEPAVRERAPAGRLAVLRAKVLEQKLGTRTLALGKAIVDGQIDSDEARSTGEKLLAEAEELGPMIGAVDDQELMRPLRRELGEAFLEALFAVERKAMSLRLNRYKASSGH